MFHIILANSSHFIDSVHLLAHSTAHIPIIIAVANFHTTLRPNDLLLLRLLSCVTQVHLYLLNVQ